jgi:hypothetical protein
MVRLFANRDCITRQAAADFTRLSSKHHFHSTTPRVLLEDNVHAHSIRSQDPINGNDHHGMTDYATCTQRIWNFPLLSNHKSGVNKWQVFAVLKDTIMSASGAGYFSTQC